MGITNILCGAIALELAILCMCMLVGFCYVVNMLDNIQILLKEIVIAGIKAEGANKLHELKDTSDTEEN